MSRQWIADAPSNIALIKYMGKLVATADSSRNTPTNASLSLTLDHLTTRVRVREVDGPKGSLSWSPLVLPGWDVPVISQMGQARFLKHASRCLEKLESTENRALLIESANSFPSDCGLASSASSFAALTVAMAKVSGRDVDDPAIRRRLSELSREGSGSSCRSLYTPWALWKTEGAEPVSGLPKAGQLRHLALIVDEEKKTVSSSEAHVRVTSSLLFRGRVARADERLATLLDLLKRSSGENDLHAWNQAANIVWAESWDMHALFETSDPPFGYFVPGSVQALNAIRELSSEIRNELGTNHFREPMVTMDAGPNVHVILWVDPMTESFVHRLQSKLHGRIKIIDSNQFRNSDSGKRPV